jgi:hypothetical protein
MEDMNKASAPPIYLTTLREEKTSVGDPGHFGADPASFFIDLKLKDAKKYFCFT